MLKKIFSFKEESAKKTVDFVLRYLIEHKIRVLIAIAAILLSSLLAVLPAWYIKDAIDALNSEEIPPMSTFFVAGVVIVLFYLIKSLINFIQHHSVVRLETNVVYKLRRNFYYHLQKMGMEYYDRSKGGEIMSRFIADTQHIQSTISAIFNGPLRDIPQLFFLLGIMFYRSWAMSCIVMIAAPIVFMLIRYFGRLNTKISKQRLQVLGEVYSGVDESVRGAKVIKAFCTQENEKNLFERHYGKLIKFIMKSADISALSGSFIELTIATVFSIVIMAGGFMITSNSMTGAELASFLLAFTMISKPLRALNSINYSLSEGLAAGERIQSILKLETETPDIPNAKTFAPPLKEGIDIKINHFTYSWSSGDNGDASQHKKVLQNIDIHIPKGSIVALVGESGGGKTTLANLLPRFYELEHGSIQLDGIDIRTLTRQSLRRNISLVSQDIFLFHNTVRNNITYGNSDCSDDELIVAAKAAYAHDFIMSLSKGYDTIIGEGGIKISGGQRQRLVIARALLKNAPILILDEATSALDTETEKDIQTALKNLMKNRTTIAIAHRLSTIHDADCIYVIDKGRVLEHGSHQELIAHSGAYNKLYNMQIAPSAT